MSSHRKPSLQAIDHTVWKLVELEETISDFKASNQEVLESRINQYVELLGKLRAVAHLLNDDIPLDLLKFVDEGGNPDVFTRDMFKGCLEANQEAKGKVVAFRELRNCLAKEMNEEYPEEFGYYSRMTGGRSSAWVNGTEMASPGKAPAENGDGK